MEILLLLLLIGGLVCFIMAAFGLGARVNLIALGLACWILTQVIAAFQTV